MKLRRETRVPRPILLKSCTRQPILIADYDPRWPQRYEEERRLILSALEPALVAIEHMGSTAVPGLAAKPIIDLMVGIRRLDEAVACVKPLRQIGYEYVPEYELYIPERRYFRKGPRRARTHHLHMCERTSEFWERQILFRDYLIAHPKVAAQYAALKRQLARDFAGHGETYSEAKSSFITSTVEQARAWRAGDHQDSKG
jgi:GrpB-like predicted nucleotidyltransferase (UPF0157 family)